MTNVDFETGEIRTALPPMQPEIAASIMYVKAGIAQLGFDERNDHGKYSYASVDKFYTAIRPLETEAGITWLLDETSFDIRAGDSGKGWVFVQYDAWVMHKGGATWGPLRRHLAAPVTGPQTFGALESYARKALARGLYMVPTGEKDGDDTAPRDDAPVTRQIASKASPAVRQQSGDADIARATVQRIRKDINAALYLEELNAKGIFGPTAELDEKLIKEQPNGQMVWDDLVRRDALKRDELLRDAGSQAHG